MELRFNEAEIAFRQEVRDFIAEGTAEGDA